MMWDYYMNKRSCLETLKPICPTRWTGKSCIKTTLDQYIGLIDALK